MPPTVTLPFRRLVLRTADGQSHFAGTWTDVAPSHLVNASGTFTLVRVERGYVLYAHQPLAVPDVAPPVPSRPLLRMRRERLPLPPVGETGPPPALPLP